MWNYLCVPKYYSVNNINEFHGIMEESNYIGKDSGYKEEEK